MQPIHVEIEASNEERYLVSIRARSHEIVLDEPLESGGSDKGPTPLEALLAALASCLIMTIRLHAERRRIEISRVEAKAEADVDPRSFIGRGEPGLHNIRLRVRVFTSAEPGVVESLVQRAEELCPVAATIRAPRSIELSTEIVRSN